MFRIAAPRFAASARPMGARAVLRSTQLPTRRFVSTAPAEKSRSWKNLAGRVGVVGAIIYYYNTTDVFAEEPRHAVQALPETENESEILPTIDSLAEQRKERKAVQAQLEAQKLKQQEAAEAAQAQGGEGEGGMGGLEEEADQQGAFNPETGEINWDCPCLGGMAHGPCGEEFKAAFSCFVYSTEEPKGMDCIDKFKGMQNCFREYPEVYGSELDSDADDEDDMPADGAPALSGGDVPGSAETTSVKSASPSESKPVASSQRADHATSAKGKQSGEPSSKPAAASDPALELVPGNYKPDPQEQDVAPHKAFDTRSANEEAQKEESK